MFKLQRQNNKQDNSGERVDFRFSNFQALQVPKGWDRLSLSIICVETGKPVAKLNKALVKNGSCQWPETLLESVWISQDDSSLELEESLYKFVVSMGSARSGILGEGTINLASYVGSRMSSPVLLPLKKCNYGTTIQVKVHFLTPRSKFRDESKSSGSYMKEQDLDHDGASKSNETDNLSDGSAGLLSTHDVGSNSDPSKFEIKERSSSASVSNNSFSSAESFTRKEKFPSRNHLKSEGSKNLGKQVRQSPDQPSPQNDFFVDNHSVSNQSSYDTNATNSRENQQNNGKDFTASSLMNSGSSRNLLEAAEDTIEELRIEAKMWERNARKLMLDLDILRQEFSDQSKKQADLVMELSAAYSEQGSLKREIENLKLIVEESTSKYTVAEDSIYQSKGQNHIQEELENEIRHQQELNTSLALQLKGSQESNVELLSLLQELEETIEQQKVEIECLSSLHLRLADMKNSVTACSQDKVNFFQEQEESEETLGSSVQFLKKALQDKNHELESERRMNRQTISDVKEEYERMLSVKEAELARLKETLLKATGRQLENNGHPDKASIELIRDIEALREKVQELERDCAELTQENLDLFIKFKEESDIRPHIHHDEEDLNYISRPQEKIGEHENSKHFIKLVKQLEVAFHHLKRPWYKLSSHVSDQCKSHLDNLESLSEDGASSSKVLSERILTYLFDLNHLLETRIVECEEILKKQEQEIQERSSSAVEAQKKLEEFSLQVQAHDSSKEELQVQCSSLLRELDQKRSELDKLQADLQTNEEEKNWLLEHKRELEVKVADLQKERDQVEEKMDNVLRETTSISRCMDNLQIDHKELCKNMDAQVCENKLLESKLAQLEGEKLTFEEQLVGIKEKNETVEARIRLMTVERESRQSELDESRSIAMNLQEEIGKLESDMNTNIADLEEKLEDMQILWSQAREECGHLTKENQKLQGSLENLFEEYKTVQQSNSELERKNMELHEHRVHLEAQVHEAQKSLSNSLIKVKALEENLNSMWKDFSLKDERLNAELNTLIQENKNETEKLMQQESLSHHRYSEKLREVENLKNEVEKLTNQISEMDEERRLASDAVCEVSNLRSDKAQLESALEDVHAKYTLTEKELTDVRIESELKIQDFMSELATSRQSFEKLMVDHEKILKLLPNNRANEEKLKTAINDLELQLTLSRYEHQKLHEESANLKFQLQKTKELEDEVSNLKSELKDCMSEKETLEASLNTISGDCEEMKAEKASFAGKISSLQKVLSELENSNRKRICLEEKVEQMESDLTEKEKFCAQVADLENELRETKREKEQYQQKMYKMEEEKDNCLRKVHSLEAEVKMMEEEKKLYAKKFEQSDTPKSTKKYTNINTAPRKLSQSQENLVNRLHPEGENGFSDGVSQSVEADHLARIQLLENKLVEALEANKKYKIQLQRFKTEERKGHSPVSKKSDGDSEMVKRFEHTKTLLETELKDIRERYFQMSLKYAEVEAQREDLVMKLKAAKSGKKWFS